MAAKKGSALRQAHRNQQRVQAAASQVSSTFKFRDGDGKELTGSQALKMERWNDGNLTYLAAKMKGRLQRWQAGAQFLLEPARIDLSTQTQIQMFNTPGITIEPGELWMLSAGQQSMVLAVVHGVFRAYKGGMKPFKVCGLSPAAPVQNEPDHRVERVQVLMCQGGLVDPAGMSCVQAGLIQHPVQFVCKFPRTAWEVCPGGKIKVAPFYHSFIREWVAGQAAYWRHIGGA